MILALLRYNLLIAVTYALRRLDEIFYCEALKNEIRHLIISKMPDFVIVATLDKLIQPTRVS